MSGKAQKRAERGAIPRKFVTLFHAAAASVVVQSACCVVSRSHCAPKAIADQCCAPWPDWKTTDPSRVAAPSGYLFRMIFSLEILNLY